MEKIKLDLKYAAFIRNGGSSQPETVDVQRHFPPMIDLRTQGQPNFAHNLGPHVQGGVRVLPSLQRQFRPTVMGRTLRCRLQRCLLGEPTRRAVRSGNCKSARIEAVDSSSKLGTATLFRYAKVATCPLHST